MIIRFVNWIKKHDKLLFIVLFISFLAMAVNLFKYPAYFDDEGTYMSQAWSILKLGRLAPYTYWYDHAPLGWIIISIWSFLTGGFFSFGPSINSGRVLMLVINLMNTYFIYQIVGKLTNKTAAFLAAIFFSLSPLAVVLHRMVFLDNIAILFVMLSVYLLLDINTTLKKVIFSGILMGMGILVKESLLFFIPPMLLHIFLSMPKQNKSFAVIGWSGFMAATVSFYPLLALIKGELFPSGTFLGGSEPHVSLIETFKWQMQRSGGFFLDPESEFIFTLKNSWIKTAPILLSVGAVSTIVNLLIGFKNRKYLLLSLLSVFYILYLIRGGVVNDQYIIPLLPFLAINIGLLMGIFHDQLSKQSRVLAYIPSLMIFAFASLVYLQNTSHYVVDQTSPQIESIEWLKKNADNDDIIAVDAYALVDLFKDTDHDIYEEEGTQHYWKIDRDPRLRNDLLKNNWQEIDYILATPKLLHDIKLSGFDLLGQAYSNSYISKTFEVPDKQKIEELESNPFYSHILIASNDPVHVYKRNTDEDIALDVSWKYYKDHFIHSYGQVIDPQNEMTTSEGQSYAMLRAVLMNDQDTFNDVWKWTQDHLQHRIQDELISWLWIKNNNGEYFQADPESASDADQDIALALILAHKRWGDESYKLDARALIDDIWKKEVVDVNGRYYLVSGSTYNIDGKYLYNPSYLSPAHYRLFLEYSDNDWDKLIDDSYLTLNRISYSGQGFLLPPNWQLIDAETGNFNNADNFFENSQDYGYDAFRVSWRLGLDYRWNLDTRAKEYLQDLARFYDQKLEENGKIYATYSQSGISLSEFSSLSTSTAPFMVYSTLNGEKAFSYFNDHIKPLYSREGYWEEKDNYYGQNWAALSLLFYKGKFVNNFDIVEKANLVSND